MNAIRTSYKRPVNAVQMSLTYRKRKKQGAGVTANGNFQNCTPPKKKNPKPNHRSSYHGIGVLPKNTGLDPLKDVRTPYGCDGGINSSQLFTLLFCAF
jgi:hypothetical protein